MKIMIIRHGDPDYEHDSLTEKGWREAEYLSQWISKIPAKEYYVSPLGRAKDTASLTLNKVGCTAIECEWLREFDAPIDRPDVKEHKKNTWDWLPQDWANEEFFYDRNEWLNHPVMAADDVKKQYDWVVSNFDAVIEKHGYRRDGNVYRAVQPNRDVIVFFCHFGLECVLLSRLINTSPMVLWHHLCAAPSSVTILNTEERREGIVSFRISNFGDVSHLYANDEEPSFQARFCETYDNMDERHD